MSEISKETVEAHWNETLRLMKIVMLLWVVFSFGIHAFAVQLNSVVILGFPLGFYMAAQGSLIAFVVICFWNAKAQNAIDEKYGVAED